MNSQKATFEKTTDNKIIIRVDERILISDSITEAISIVILPEILNSDKKVFEIFFQINEIK